MVTFTELFICIHRRRNGCGVLQKDILVDPRQVTSVGSRDAEALSQCTMFEVNSSGNRLAFDFRTVHRRELIRVRRLSTLQSHVDDTLTRIRAEHAQSLRLVEVENIVAHRERPFYGADLVVTLAFHVQHKCKLALVRVERLAPIAGRVGIVALHVERCHLHVRSITTISNSTLRRNGEFTITSLADRRRREISRWASQVLVLHWNISTISVRHHCVFAFRCVGKVCQ